MVMIVSYWNILYLGKKGFFLINLFYLGIFVIYTNYIFIYLLNNDVLIYYDLFTVFYLEENLPVTISFYIDIYNYSYINLTLTIGWTAYCYAYSYMRDEIFLEKFLFLLLSFLLSMVLLLLANNFIILLLGWELIGITSYFLINFWVTKISTFKAAFKAFIFNRLSDLGIIVFLIFYLNYYNTLMLNFDVWFYHYSLYIFYEINSFLINGYDIIIFFLMISTSCKSAQFGFHVWLPDSMEAPVPASALIHSATLVSAGIYLINKFWTIILLSNYVIIIFLILSTWTSFYGSFIALYQTDLKRILAYSTISHCGILMTISYLNNIYILILYLYVHGFFKSLSFMCVGNLIKTSLNIQDYRFMGQKYQIHKFEYFFLNFSLMNLSGYSLSLGFFAKHFIILNFYFLNIINYISFFFFLLTACSGFFYTFFLINNVFFNFSKSFPSNSYNKSSSYTSSTPPFQLYSITILTIYTFILLYYILSFIYLPKFFFLGNNYINDFLINNLLFNKELNIFYLYINIFLWNFFIVFFIFIFYKNYFFFYTYIYYQLLILFI